MVQACHYPLDAMTQPTKTPKPQQPKISVIQQKGFKNYADYWQFMRLVAHASTEQSHASTVNTEILL